MSQLRYSTRYPVPVSALELNEDIRNLEQIRRLLDWIDPLNVADNPALARKAIWTMFKVLDGFKRHAEQKMRIEYLDPRRKKIHTRKN